MPTKKTKPKFLRPNYGRSSRARIKGNWRMPRGTDNKKRQKIRHMGFSPSIGYGQDKRIKYDHPRGANEVFVQNLSQLPSEKGSLVRIAAGVGRKLRTQIEEQAKKNGLLVLNPKINRQTFVRPQIKQKKFVKRVRKGSAKVGATDKTKN
ncbi:MAG: eL32 family ribosomal protein [Candidatus Micrarchaeia archaeon]